MKNRDIAEVFRAAAEIMEMTGDDESVYLEQEASVLVLHHPVVGRITFRMDGRITPVTSLDKIRALLRL